MSSENRLNKEEIVVGTALTAYPIALQMLEEVDQIFKRKLAEVERMKEEFLGNIPEEILNLRASELEAMKWVIPSNFCGKENEAKVARISDYAQKLELNSAVKRYFKKKHPLIEKSPMKHKKVTPNQRDPSSHSSSSNRRILKIKRNADRKQQPVARSVTAQKKLFPQPTWK